MVLRVVKSPPLEAITVQDAPFDIVAHAKGLERAIAALREQLGAADASVRSIRMETDAKISLGIANAVLQRDAISEELLMLCEAYAVIRVEHGALLRENMALNETSDMLRRDNNELVARAESDTANAAKISAENEHLREQLQRACESLAAASSASDAESRRLAREIDRIQGGRIWRMKRALARAFGNDSY